MIKIDFYDLINNYDENLLDNLRGFGSDNEFLKFWVPGTDTLKSFYNLVDALYESENYNFIVNFEKNYFDKIYLNTIHDFLKKISSTKKTINETKIELSIEIDKKLYNNFKKNINNKNLKIKLEKVDIKNKIITFKSREFIEKIYLDNLQKINCNEYFVKDFNIQENLFSRKLENYDLYFVIENKIVTHLFHNCIDNNLKKLINIFFDLCLNKSIQEISDHAVIYLEERIRLVNNELIKKGIILPSHGGKYFDYLNIIVREIFQEYIKKENLNIGINKNYFKKSFKWINLPEDQKFNEIDNILKKIKYIYSLDDECIEINSIDSNFKINLGINKAFKDLQLKKNVLLEIEIKLKEIDNTLEVFVDESLDKNKLRLKNSPQTKLLN